MKYTENDLRRFWDKVEEGGEFENSNCLLWKGTKYTNGVGSFWLNGKMVSANRFIYFVHTGRDVKVQSLCPNKCVNTKHMVEWNKGAPKKLTTEQVEAIRQSRLRGSQLAKEYGVSAMTISRIRRGLAYPPLP